MTREVGRNDAAGDDIGSAPRRDLRRDGRLDPLGEALRATYRADNHDTLSRDVTGLMLDLARVPFEPHEFEALAPRVPPAPPPGLLMRIGMALRRTKGRRQAG